MNILSLFVEEFHSVKPEFAVVIPGEVVSVHAGRAADDDVRRVCRQAAVLERNRHLDPVLGRIESSEVMSLSPKAIVDLSVEKSTNVLTSVVFIITGLSASPP